jgi:hypothetical protein
MPKPGPPTPSRKIRDEFIGPGFLDLLYGLLILTGFEGLAGLNV